MTGKNTSGMNGKNCRWAKKGEFIHENQDRFGEEWLTIWAARCGYELNAYKDEKDIPSRSSWSRAMTEDGEEIVNCVLCKRPSPKKDCQLLSRGRVFAKTGKKLPDRHRCNVCNRGYGKLCYTFKTRPFLRDQWKAFPAKTRGDFMHESKDSYGEELMETLERQVVRRESPFSKKDCTQHMPDRMSVRTALFVPASLRCKVSKHSQIKMTRLFTRKNRDEDLRDDPWEDGEDIVKCMSCKRLNKKEDCTRSFFWQVKRHDGNYFRSCV